MLETDCCCLQGLEYALEVELQAGEMLYLPAGPLQQPDDGPSHSCPEAAALKQLHG